MRIKSIISWVILLSSIVSHSKPLDQESLLKEAQSVRSKIKKNDSFANKKKAFTQIMDLINTALKEHQNENPLEGTDDERNVLKVSYSFAHVAELVNTEITDLKCDRAKHLITLEDMDMSQPEKSPSPHAMEALNYLDLFCKTSSK